MGCDLGLGFHMPMHGLQFGFRASHAHAWVVIRGRVWDSHAHGHTWVAI